MLLFVLIWLISGVFLCFQVVKANRVTKLGADMVRNKTAPPEWIPFIRVDTMPGLLELIFRSFFSGPLALISSLCILLLTGILVFVSPFRYTVPIASVGARALCAAFGLIVVEQGLRAKEAACIVANHNSALDIIILLCRKCCFVSMHSVKDLPVVGTIARAIGCIFVVRDSPESRLAAKEAINSRLTKNTNACQLVIFPEGSTNNGAYLLQFRRGAFEPAVPVQPVRIEFQDFNLNFTIVTLSQLFALACVLPKRQVTLHWLPLLPPSGSAEESANQARLAIANTPSAYNHLATVLVDNVSHRDAVAASKYFQS